MSTLRSLSIVLAFCSLAACSYTPPKPGSTATSPQAAYSEAKELLDSGSYESAITAYEQLEARFPYGRHAQQAQLDIIYTYYRLGEMESVVAAADRFVRLHPNHSSVDYALYLKGLANENTRVDEWLPFLPQQPLSERDSKGAEVAFETFKDLINRYPDSRYADDAHKRMQRLLEALAQHEINAARYYLNRRAPLAAINRAQTVLTRYSNSKSVETALELMVKGYETLQLKTLGEDTKRILRQNFPNNPSLAKNNP